MKVFNEVRAPRRLAIAAAVMVAVGFGATVAPAVASAGTATSSTGYYTDNGRGYFNRAEISTSVGRAIASSIVGTSNGQGAPGGWMGARARLFSSNGALVQESSTSYSGANAYQLSIPTSRNAGGTWYSYGVTYGWNGSGYNAHYTFQSPNQNS